MEAPMITRRTLLVGSLGGAALWGDKPPHARPAILEATKAKVDPALPLYKPPSSEVAGTLRGTQSDTTPGLLKLWIDGFRKHCPKVSFDVNTSGSGGAGPGLTNGTDDFGFIAREMMIKEEKPFVAKFGYAPLEIGVCGGSYSTLAFTDALAIFVNEANPLDKLTFTQFDAMYSKTRKRGAAEVTTWGQLGLKGDWADKPIHLWGVKPENGFEHFLQERILMNGAWKDGIEGADTVFPEPPAVAADK